MEVQLTLFDYSIVDADTTAYLRQNAHETRGLLKRTTEDIIQIGKNLVEAKSRLPHGQFIPWVKAELGISQPTAWRFMQVAQGKEIKAKSFTVNDLMAQISAPDEVIAQVETGALPPTIPAIQEATQAQPNHLMHIMSSSETPEWCTPQDIVEHVLRLFGEIDTDPCSNSHETPNVPAKTLYTREDDGLGKSWHGRVYMNPPYGTEIGKWIEKLLAEHNAGVSESISLLPARVDTSWFQPLYEHTLCMVRGRLQFSNAQYSAPFPSVIVYIGNRQHEFIEVFEHLGNIIEKRAQEPAPVIEQAPQAADAPPLQPDEEAAQDDVPSSDLMANAVNELFAIHALLEGDDIAQELICEQVCDLEVRWRKYLNNRIDEVMQRRLA